MVLPNKVLLINYPKIIKRAIQNAFVTNESDDLQADEAKVFRPLFVYRQQVSRRLKLKNDRKLDNGRIRKEKINPNSYNYYDYRYPAYYY